MKVARPQSAVDIKLSTKLEEVRQRLFADDQAEKLERPLAFFTVANDRRLPLAFLGNSVREVIETPYSELLSTPGVGQKKIASLVSLLNRIVAAPVPELKAANPLPSRHVPTEVQTVLPGDPGFDAAAVPEVHWEAWRAAVVRHNLGRETLGRLAASLQDLPRVVWNTPLETYTGLTLAKIRALKTHGEKRVRVIVEVFGSLHRMVGAAPPVGHLYLSLRPKFILPLEAWILEVLQRELPPDAKEIRRAFVEPLMAQVQIDAGETIYRLAEGRLGLNNSNASVRQAAKRMGLTRARVYQLLNEVSAIMQVRWPEALPLIAELRSRLHTLTLDTRELEMFDATLELFFPGRRRAGEFVEAAANESGSNGRYASLGPRQRAG